MVADPVAGVVGHQARGWWCAGRTGGGPPARSEPRAPAWHVLLY